MLLFATISNKASIFTQARPDYFFVSRLLPLTIIPFLPFFYMIFSVKPHINQFLRSSTSTFQVTQVLTFWYIVPVDKITFFVFYHLFGTRTVVISIKAWNLSIVGFLNLSNRIDFEEVIVCWEVKTLFHLM